jgi:dTDP-4-dehydrorhamnose reductase
MFKNNKIIVVGAGGYIGAEIYNSAQRKYHVLGTTSSGSDLMHKFRLDLPEEFDYSDISPNDVVLFSAAISAPDICSNEFSKAWTANVTGTSLFIRRAIDRGARVVFFSSDTVYGAKTDLFDESAACNPAGEYAQMKREVELKFIGEDNFKSIRLSYVFSKFDKFTKYLVDCVRKQQKAEIFHPFLRSVVHRDDVVEGVLALAIRWNEFQEKILNFGGPEVLSRIEFAESIRDVFPLNLNLKVIEPGEEFFSNRPRVISMKSPVFPRLLGRSPRTLREAAMIEFASH